MRLILFRMADRERLRERIGPEANSWTIAHLDQLSLDIEQMAVILLDFYHSRREDCQARSCGSPNFDVQRTDR